MLKYFKFCVIIGVFGGFFVISPTNAQEAPDNEDPTDILSALDSLTFLFRESCSKNTICETPPDGLDFSENAVLPGFDPEAVQQMMDKMGSAIPLVYNRHVRGFLDLYAYRIRQTTGRIMSISDYYFPIFEQILDEEDLPLEFKYLAVVESALNPHAMSWAGASGLWQFMPQTGRLYGLKIDHYIDERRDVERATRAACAYFKDSYAKFGDWLLVIASYNCGPGNVAKAVARAGGSRDFWKIMPYLPAETRGYVPAFIAVAYLMSNPDLHGLKPVPVDMNMLIEKVPVTADVSFYQIAQALDIPVEELSRLNPSYKRKVIPGNSGPYSIYLPYQFATRFRQNEESIYTQRLTEQDENGETREYRINHKHFTHTVRRGETLQAIANKYGVKVSDIRDWNEVRKKAPAGGKLTIFKEVKEVVNTADSSLAKEPEEPKQEAKVTVLNADDIKLYKVAPGDTLWSISKKFGGVSIEQLRNDNNLSANEPLKSGQVLKIKTGG